MNIKHKIFFFMCILIVVSATAFSVILYNTQRKALLDGVNNNLLTAAYAAQNILPDNYHDNIVDEHSVSKAEFDKIVNTNNRLCRKLNLQYIWSVMVIDDQIVFTSSTSPSMDVEKDDHAKFFDVHQDPHAFNKVFSTKKATISSFENEWGHGRMLLLPGNDIKGRPYCFGASMSMNQVNSLLRKTMVNSLIISLIVFLVGAFLSFILANSFSKPITELTSVAKKIARGDLALTIQIRGVSELKTLSESINSMARAIRSKIQEVKDKNTILIQEIVKRKKTEAALQKAHDELDQKVHMRTYELNAVNYQLKQEITEKKRVEKQIKNSRDQFQSLVTNIPGITFRCQMDKDWTMMFMSGNVERISGYPETDFIDNSVRSYGSIIHPDDAEYVNLEVNKAINAGEPWEIEYRLNHKDESLRWVYEKGRGITGCDGKIEFLDGFILDITEKKKTELLLSESQERYKSFITHANEGIYRIDIEPPVSITLPKQDLIEKINQSALIAEVNESLSGMYGLAVSDMVGKPAIDFAPNYGARASLVVESENYSVDNVETIDVDKDGQTVFLLESYHCEIIDNKLQRVWGVQRNITKRKLFENELARSNELYSDLANNKLTGIYRIRVSSQRNYDDEAWDDSELPPFAFEFINDKFCEIFNVSRQELEKKPGFITDFVYEQDKAEWIKINAEANRKHSPFKWEGRFFIEAKISWLYFESLPRQLRSGDTVWTGICFDITDKKKAERKLIEAHKLFEEVIKQSPIPMVVASPDGELRVFNEAVVEQLGIDEDSGIKQGVNLNEMKPSWKDYDADGNIIPTEKLPLAQALQGKAVKNLEVRVVRSDGTERWEIVNGTPIYDNEGHLLAGFVSFPDITDLKLAIEALHIQRDLGIALSTTRNMEDALEIVLETITKVKEISCVGLYLVDTHMGELNLAAHRGLSAEFVRNSSRYNKDSMQFKIVMAGEPLYQMYSEFSSAENDALHSENLRALGIIPINHRNRTIAALNVASRTFDNIPPSSRHTVETISTQIGGVISRIEAEKRLLESQEKLQSLFDSIDDFLFILDSEGRISQINPVVIKRLGYSEAELINMPVIEIHPPDQREKTMEIIADMLAGKAASCPISLQTKKGSLIPVETKVSKGKWGGEDILFGISRDISERILADEALKKSANTQAVLLREVNHRVKNNLSAIIGMLLKELDLAKSEGITIYQDMLHVLIGRIEGLSTVHSMLSASGWNPLLLTDLCEEVIHGALQGLPINKKVSVDVATSLTRISSQQAHQLTLVINELTTNTIKHAFKERKAGKISVNIFHDNGSTCIVFKDDGPGYPKAFIQADFSNANVGFDLILGIVQESLRGKVLLKNDNGAETSIIYKPETFDEIAEA